MPEEITDDPVVADVRNFYKVELWTGDDFIERLLFAGTSLDGRALSLPIPPGTAGCPPLVSPVDCCACYCAWAGWALSTGGCVIMQVVTAMMMANASAQSPIMAKTRDIVPTLIGLYA